MESGRTRSPGSSYSWFAGDLASNRWLSAEQIHPWRFHSWQHIQEPEAFLQRARPVLRLYEHAAALFKQGIWVVCTDEKTSIQAREAEQAPRPAIQNHPLYQSPRYHRHGAVNLMAALSVVDGLVYGQCYMRKRFLDFRTFLETAMSCLLVSQTGQFKQDDIEQSPKGRHRMTLPHFA